MYAADKKTKMKDVGAEVISVLGQMGWTLVQRVSPPTPEGRLTDAVHDTAQLLAASVNGSETPARVNRRSPSTEYSSH